MCVLVCKAFGRSPIDAHSMSVPLYWRDTISFTPFVFSSWRHVPITLYLLVWFACSSCRCIVIMLDAHVDLCVLSWIIGVLTIFFCFASSLVGFLVFPCSLFATVYGSSSVWY